MIGHREVMTYFIGHYSTVGHKAEFHRLFAFLADLNVIAYIVVRVVWHHERRYLEECTWYERLDVAFKIATRSVGQFLRHSEIALHSAMHGLGCIDGDVIDLANAACRTYMVGVVMGDEQSHDLFERQAIVAQILLNGAHRYACVD